jgi:Protein of unknown function (DUF2855)
MASVYAKAPALDFLVRREDLREFTVAERSGPAEPELEPGEVLLGIDRFGFTSNNVTYAAFGEAMQYWAFFPAPEGWGRIPVWGFADVTRSAHDAIGEGERVFGYLPMSTHLVVRPDRVSPAGFVDASPHRAALPGAYQQYSRVAADPGYTPEQEDHQALLRPLFMTSFLIEDFLTDNALFGAQTVVFSSASSKTALGTAFLLSENPSAACEVIGLTSPEHISFCERVGYYDRVIAYDQLESISPDSETVFVDMAGAGRVLNDVHHHLRDHLKHSCIVGATHWEQREVHDELPGPEPQFFFAPTQIAKRIEDWGSGGVEKGFARAWQAFMPSVSGWMQIRYGRGPKAVEAVYRNTLEGKVDPKVGQILSLRS